MQTTFNTKNIEKTLSSFIADAQYIASDLVAKFEQLKQQVNVEYYNIICRQVPQSSLVHLQFGHPLGQYSKQQCRLIQKNLEAYNPESNTLLVDLESGKVLSQFRVHVPITPYEKDQRQLVVDAVGTLPINKTRLTAYWVPYGMTFQCIFTQDHWLITTQNIPRLNESTFGGQQTFQSLFEAILKRQGVTLNMLNKDHIYTFHVAISNFSLLPIEEDQVYLYDIKRAYTNTEAQDPLWEQLDLLLSSRINIPNTQAYGLTHNNVFGKNSWFEEYRYQFNLPVPMQSLLIEVGNQTFEIHTAVKELVINFNVHRRKTGVRQDTPTQLKEYIAEQVKNNSHNQYIQQYLALRQ